MTNNNLKNKNKQLIKENLEQIKKSYKMGIKYYEKTEEKNDKN